MYELLIIDTVQAATVQAATAYAATAKEWFDSFSSFWAAGILPIILACCGYKTLRVKYRNRAAKKREQANNAVVDILTDDDAGDKTRLAKAIDALKHIGKNGDNTE